MASEWKFRIFLFVRAVDVTLARKTAVASVYVTGGSRETLENERKMFDNVVRLSTTGQEPAQVLGINLTAKPAMRDGFVALITSLTNPAWVVTANTTLPGYADGEVIMLSDNLPQGAVGMIVDWEAALDFLERQFGLQVIEPPVDGRPSRLAGSVRAVNLLGRFPVPAYDPNMWGGLGERIWDGYTALTKPLRRDA